jgi:hypothetical protein
VSLSIYDVSIPVYQRLLQNLDHFLSKAEAFAAEEGVALSALAESNFGHGMANFIRQIQFASDAAKSGAARLAGVEPPSMPDTETTFPELHARIAKTLDYLATITPEQVNGDPAREIVLKFPNGAMAFTAQSFLTTFSVPNFVFHITTAYDLLRSQGVPLGKMDFLAGAQAPAAQAA